MKRLLLPLDESMKSLESLNYAREHYSPEEYELVLIMVDESIDYTASRDKAERTFAELERKLDIVKESITEFTVHTRAEVGKAGPRIVKCARECGAEAIAMTRFSSYENRYSVGKTTEYVLVNAPCNVIIVCEEKPRGEFTGLIYRKAEATVNLRGKLSVKQSECLIPSVSSDCIYHIEVIRGRIRFIHKSYNPETGNWDQDPRLGQPSSYDIAAGQRVSIPVKACSVEGKADRIRISNRNMKTEAVFKYRIVADK